jgi:hypothetical protein
MDIGSPKVQLWLATPGPFVFCTLCCYAKPYDRTVLHDPMDYPEPLEFNPDRFIKNGKLDPSVRDPVAAFGFGRR